MSVILTASRKSVKPKSAKPKKKKSTSRGPPIKQSSQETFTPPMSTAKTCVWHWMLENVPTTVMLSKEENEVWCNGEILDTIEGFSDDIGGGGVIDFTIWLDHSEIGHKARIKRSITGEKKDGILHHLFVDGFMIMEHTNSSSETPISAAPSPYMMNDSGIPPYMGNGANAMDGYGGAHANGNPIPPPPAYNNPDDECKKDI